MRKLLNKRGIINAFLATAIFIFSSGCKKDEVKDKIEKWTGKTSQNQKIYFTVKDNFVTYMDITVTAPTFKGEMSFITIDEIIDNSFTSVNYNMEVSGEFLNYTSSKGTFKIDSTSGTWTATKQ